MYIYLKRTPTSESLSLRANYNSFPWFSFLNLFLSLSLTPMWKAWVNTGKTMHSDNKIGQMCGPGWGACRLEGGSLDASSSPVLCLVTSRVTTSLLGLFALAYLVRNKLFKQETKCKAIIYCFIWFLSYGKVATVWRALRLIGLWLCRTFAGRAGTQGMGWPPQLRGLHPQWCWDTNFYQACGHWCLWWLTQKPGDSQ